MKGSWLRGLAIAVLLAVYGHRALEGVRAGWALEAGHLLRNYGKHAEAAPLLESAAIGANTRRALLMAGEVRLNQWDKEVRKRGALGADPQGLVRAAESFLKCRCAAPAARDAWRELGEVYDAIEWIGRERRSEVPYSPPSSPWARIGRPGRVAIGMLRGTIEVAPHWLRTHDTLSITLWNYGLKELAREAVRASARALPIYHRHPYHRIPGLPEWFLLEFVAGSRAVLGQVPLVPPSEHLLDLGRLERRIGQSARAIEAFEAVLDQGGDALRLADAHFNLGLALADVGRNDEARLHFEAALGHSIFRPSALRGLARVDEAQGKHQEALDRLRRLRWELPGELWPCLDFAELARRLGDWPAALEALRWAKLKHEDEPEPYVALAETHLQLADYDSAIAVVNELESLLGADAPEVRGLRRRIAGDSGRRNR